MSNIDSFKSDFDALLKRGSRMDVDLLLRHKSDVGKLDNKQKKIAKGLEGAFEKEYQRWYTESSAVIRQLIPDRLNEFEELYRGNGKRKGIESHTYQIQDWLNGVRSGTKYDGEKYYDDFAIVSMRFRTQLGILRSAEARFETTLLDIRQLVQADLFDSELDAARELLKNGFGRGAGAISGVILERHLAQVVANHRITTRKKHPAISDLNDLLKGGGVLDVPNWRFIQRLGDIRNLCDHNKERDPTDEEVAELIDGVEKISKTLF